MLSHEQLSEPIAIQDIYVSGLARVDHIGGGVFRFTFYSQDEGVWRIAARLIAHMDAVPAAITMAAKAIGISIIAGCPSPEKPPLH